jgi:hypothetical protein
MNYLSLLEDSKRQHKCIIPINYYSGAVVPLNTAKGSVLPSSYKILTTTKHRMDNQWLVLTLKEWYNDCKAQILAETREICGAWQGNKLSIRGTQFSSR